MTRKKALTLVEIVVALGLLAIFALIAFPELTSYQKLARKSQMHTRMRFAMQAEIEREKAGLSPTAEVQSDGWIFLFDRRETPKHGMREVELTIREESTNVQKQIRFLIP